MDGQARKTVVGRAPRRAGSDRGRTHGRQLRHRERGRRLGLEPVLGRAGGRPAPVGVPGGTIIRVETDADGNAAYEAHMVKADGTPVTVYVNKQFEVVSVQTGMPGPAPAYGGSSSSSGAST